MLLVKRGAVVSRQSGKRQRNAAGAFLVFAIAVLVLLQGGFVNAPTCCLGAAAWVVAAASSLRKSQRGRKVSVVALLFLTFAGVYVMSAVANGLTLTTLSEAGAWFGIAGASFLASCQDEQERGLTLKWLTWLGIASAALGMLVYVQLLPLEGMMNANRLQFFFQYANAAGAWYAVFALLCLASSDKKVRSCAALPLASLLLTQSMGAVVAFLAACAILGVRLWRAGRQEHLLVALVQVVAAVIAFAGMSVVPSPANVLFAILVVAFCAVWAQAERLSVVQGLLRRVQGLVGGQGLAGGQGLLNTRRGVFTLLAACALAGVCLAVAFCERLVSAVPHFLERLYHCADGIALWATSPVFGIGPDNWQYAYPYAQSAQYQATVIHNAYVQVLVDAGLLGLGLLLAVSGVALHAARKGASDMDGGVFVALLLMALHSLVDLDLQFGALGFLFAYLAGGVRAPVASVKRLQAGLVCGVLGCCLCLTGFLAEMSKTSMSVANSLQDYSETCLLYEGNPLAGDDVSAQAAYLEALYSLEEYERVAAYYAERGAASDVQALYVALSLYHMGSSEEAGRALIQELERQPYNVEFYESAKSVLDACGLNDELKGRYNEAVKRANELAAETPQALSPRQLDTLI